MIEIQIVYNTIDQKLISLSLRIQEGSSVLDALTGSGFYDAHPEAKGLPVGIFSRQVSLDTILKENDRIEIYRPLLISPKERRRQRAKMRS